MITEENIIDEKTTDVFTEEDLEEVLNIDEEMLEYKLTEYNEEDIQEFLSREEEEW